eukprot:2891390-Rhodomonas_salina.3
MHTIFAPTLCSLSLPLPTESPDIVNEDWMRALLVAGQYSILKPLEKDGIVRQIPEKIRACCFSASPLSDCGTHVRFLVDNCIRCTRVAS